MNLLQQNKYLEMSVQTATQAQLLIMLCDGAVRFCKKGIECIRTNQMQEANVCLLKVQDIVKEFMITLDAKSPLANDLNRLYEYFLHRLMEANIRKDAAPAEEVLGYLIDLRETWMQAAKASANARSGASYG